MWDAYSAGTVPVGAVVVDECGTIVSRGQNRIWDDRHARSLSRSRLAHAELNALLPLHSDRTYERFTLYTSLEPCHLCLSATLMVRIGSLRYAAAEPYSGAVGKLIRNPALDSRTLEVEGPLPAPEGLVPQLLHLRHALWRAPERDIATFYRSFHPDLVELAQQLPAPDDGASLADAFAVVEPA